jgi:hypothetical protein
MRCASFVTPVMTADGRWLDDVLCPRLRVIAAHE